MHVLILPSWYPVDSSDINGIFFRDQALALKDYGHKVGVVAAVAHPPEKIITSAPKIDSFEYDNGIPTFRKSFWSILPYFPYGNYLLWRRIARRLFIQYTAAYGMPDIIHAHSAIYAGVVAVELGSQYGLPVVLTEHRSGFARNVFMNWQLRLAAKAFENVDKRIVVSPVLGELLTRILKSDKTDWHWIPNIVANRFYSVSNNIQTDKNRPVRLLNLALMTKNKGQQILLEAFAKAFAGNSAVELWLGGDGPLRAKLVSRASLLGLDNQVKFLGKINSNDVPDLINHIDVMVISSFYETFGIVAAEALVTGKPVVATRCGGPECIIGEADGLLVKPGCPADLAQAMIKIINNLHQYPSDEIASRARTRFCGQVVAKQLSDIYQEVLQRYRT